MELGPGLDAIVQGQLCLGANLKGKENDLKPEL